MFRWSRGMFTKGIIGRSLVLTLMTGSYFGTSVQTLEEKVEMSLKNWGQVVVGPSFQGVVSYSWFEKFWIYCELSLPPDPNPLCSPARGRLSRGNCENALWRNIDNQCDISCFVKVMLYFQIEDRGQSSVLWEKQGIHVQNIIKRKYPSRSQETQLTANEVPLQSHLTTIRRMLRTESKKKTLYSYHLGPARLVVSLS